MLCWNRKFYITLVFFLNISAISSLRLLTILHSQNRYTIVSCVSLQKLHSWVSFNLHLNRRELEHKILCNILHWKAVKKNKCNVELSISAQHIILGSDMLDYSINLFIVLIQYYIYSCRFSGQKPCVSGVINLLEEELWKTGKILR
jgi:hypothetical protein